MILGGRRDGFTNSAESGAESGGSPNTRRYQLITRESEVRLARANGVVRAHGNRLARECAGASMGAESHGHWVHANIFADNQNPVRQDALRFKVPMCPKMKLHMSKVATPEPTKLSRPDPS